MLVVLSLAGAGAASPTGPGDLPAFGGLQPSLAVPKPTDDWAGVILRFRQQEQENFTGFPLETIAFWERGVELAKRSQSMETLEAVHKHFNRVPYVSDQSNYRVGDRWSTPLEFIANGGDCECYATAKFMALVRGGWPREHVYVVNGRVSGDEAHTIVIVAIMDNNQHLWWVLDNRREQPEPLAQADFVPTTAMSEHHTWLYGRLRLD